MSSKDSLSENFFLSRNLIEKTSKTDPDSEPYKSKYQAKELLILVEHILLEEEKRSSDKTVVKDKLAIVYLLIGSIYYDVEEPHMGDDYLKKAIEKLSDDPIHPDRIICYIESLKKLAYSKSNYEQLDECMSYLENAENSYKSYKEKFEVEPTEFSDLFGQHLEEDKDSLEKNYTDVLFYLAQMHLKLDNRLKSARYCHTTLERQLATGTEFDEIEWALNSATLSQLLIEQDAFKEGRNHIAAAMLYLKKQEDRLNEELEDTEEVLARKELLRYRTADVYRCWAKYGLQLLSSSKVRLFNAEGDSLGPIPEAPEELRGLLFSSIKDERLKEFEDAITADYILTYEDAKPVVLKSQKFLNKALEYYSLNDHASDYVNIIRDLSQLYQMLAFFHSSEAIQCKLYKCRIDILLSTVEQLNPTYYLKECRELWYEIGESSMFMANSKLAQGQGGDQRFIETARQLFLQSSKYFEEFLNSFELPKTGEIVRYPREHESNLIMGHMFLGAIYSKLIPKDKTEHIKALKASIRCYRIVNEYFLKFEDAKSMMLPEFSMAAEMLKLLSVKLARLERFM